MAGKTDFPDHFLMLTEEGAVSVRLDKQRVMKVEDVLRQFSGQIGVDVSNVFFSGRAYVTKTGCQMATELPHINLRTFFTLMKVGAQEVGLVPVFRPGPMVTEQTFKFYPAPDMKIFIVTDHPFEDGAMTNGSVMMGVLDIRDRKTYLLPLTNVFADSRVCMGQFAPGAAKGKAYHDHAVEFFNSTPFNDHLLDDGWNKLNDAQALFRFKPDGVQIPTPDWRKHCKLVGNTKVEWLLP